MKLLKARFRNFRLLRDLEVEFSSHPEKRLTVFRAENETGKTTMLMALQWALYGEAALPDKGRGFRMHPIDWSEEDGSTVDIEVEVDFEITRNNPGPRGSVRAATNRYRIKRSAREELSGSESTRSNPRVHLFQILESGANPVTSPDAFIGEELPPELREVFFTDGDRALTFIASDVATSTKRDRVQSAIKSLLGLGVIEDCIKHVSQAARDVNRRIKDIARGNELEHLSEAIDKAASGIENWQEREEDAKEQFDSFDLKLRDINKQIEAVLKRGDREELVREKQGVEKRIAVASERARRLLRSHSDLMKSRRIANDLLANMILSAGSKLSTLHAKGTIPSGTIPVLADCLKHNNCVCGDSLDEKDPEGRSKRAHIQKLIDDSRASDEHKKILTALYYRSVDWIAEIGGNPHSWIDEYAGVFDERDKAEGLLRDLYREQRMLEVKIDNLKDTDIQELRDTQRSYEQQKSRFRDEFIRAETERKRLESQISDDRNRRDKLLREQDRARRIVADLEVASDIQAVLNTAYRRITTEELDKVSARMNDLFLAMIGADPDEKAIIRKAAVSREFDILVYGPNDRMLNPDRDINGASRRALTISFILALTTVSEVDAPNIIDTPLGMMSGYVKRSVLRTAIGESSQLILFLTRSEIESCEDIIDEWAGVVTTLTNPAHHPLMLVNRPPTEVANIIRCECDHRGECAICRRRLDGDETPED